MNIAIDILAGLVFVIWAVLILGRGQFWMFRERDDSSLSSQPVGWPSVVAIVPARDEADVISASVTSLLAQNYPGRFDIRLIDDASTDGTGTVALAAADGSARLTILTAPPQPAGWTGKLWAVAHGISDAGTPDFLWLTDADIGHPPDALRFLVERAVRGDNVLVSTMVRLHCTSLAERTLIPAFVYFFAMLYPFRWVNRPGKTAAAAGGSMLVQRDALQASGGIASIRGEIIDDCALARRLKVHGSIWLGLSSRSASLRTYGFSDIRRMVARSAYAQLGYSPLVLAGTLAMMALIFVAPLVVTFYGDDTALRILGPTGLLMFGSMMPINRYYGVSRWWGLALPFIAATYAAFTLDSAIQHWRGRGGMWKGRAQAQL